LLTREIMIQRQRLLGEFGEFALCSSDLDAILDTACRIVAAAIGTGRAKILEIEAGGETAIVRSGIGWPPDVVGKARVSLSGRSSEAFALRTRLPLIVPDISIETRFEMPRFMQDAGIRAFVNVPILLPGGEFYGLIQIDAEEPLAIGEDTVDFLRTYATLVGPAVDRIERTGSFRSTEAYYQTLLRELRHRTGNDLAIIQSLIILRSKGAIPQVAEELAILQERLDALRLLHVQLHEGTAGDRLPLGPYLLHLADNLMQLRGREANDVRLHLADKEMQVKREVAAPLGLIINEFVTNSFKHAFNGHGGMIDIEVASLAECRALLQLSDNGVGLPIDRKAPGNRQGMGLIGILSRQVGGEAAWLPGPGTRMQTEFSTC